VLFPPPLAGDPPEDAPVRHARVRSAAGSVERQALRPRGVHGDQLDAAAGGGVPAAANLQHRDVATRVVVMGGQERGRRRDDDGGHEHGHLIHRYGVEPADHRSLAAPCRGLRPDADATNAAAPTVPCCTYMRMVAWRPQKLDEGSEVLC
jgi:hypothetical protein